MICDDRPMVGPAFGAHLQTSGKPLELVEVVHDGAALLAALDRSTSALNSPATDLVFVGVHRASASGVDAVRLARSTSPGIPLLAFGASADAHVLAAAVRAGATGVLLWDLATGSMQHPPRAREVTPRSWYPAGVPRQSLTEQESRVLREISEGRSNGEIGRLLLLSPDSVKNTAHRMFGKLGARDRAHAVALALRGGLLS